MREQRIIAYLLTLLSYFLRGMNILRRALFRRVPSLVFRSKCKVISVGNIAFGGTGKTPFIDLLLDHLPGAAVVTRGYKAKIPSYSPTILAGKAHPIQSSYGDEAYLLHVKHPGSLIAVCKNKRKAMQLVDTHVRVAILDDGFQHLQIARDIDIVLLHGEKPFDLLREGVAALKYADYIVVNYPNEEVLCTLHSLSKAPLICCRPKITSLYSSKTLLAVNKPAQASILSGIGSPENFQKSLEIEGIKVVSSVALPDHAYIAQELVEKLKDQNPIIMTEKDWARDPSVQDSNLLVAAMKLELVSGEEHFRRLIKEIS